jgi:hypothetical protein
MLQIYENFFRLDFAMHSFESKLQLDMINADSLFDDNSILGPFFKAFLNLLSDYGDKYDLLDSNLNTFF